ncbi:hypothetical protein ACX80O_03765 [Arthrobacter sp. Hz1]
MPWWTWIVIWVALLALTLLVLAVLGYHLFRKVKALLAEVEHATGMIDQSTSQMAGPEQVACDSPVAVFRDPGTVRDELRDAKALRVASRRERRIHRRVEHGQPVRLKDLPHV